MVKRGYDWEGGADISPHSKVKLEILQEYISEYVRVRCGLPQQERFRLSFIDGFSGGGVYNCGTLGSPLVVLNALKQVSAEINFRRKVEGFRAIAFEYTMYFNDLSPPAIAALRDRVKEFLNELRDTDSLVEFRVHFLEGDFGANLSTISKRVLASRVKNTIFNLDQYGYAAVTEDHLRTALSLTRSSEIFLNFSIGSFLAFLRPGTRQDTRMFDGHISDISLHKSKKEWLAAVEKIVFEQFQSLANFVSPFSINNPDGWEYWLVHFANSYRARQVYNDILHRKKTSQAHVGRSGLRMLGYTSVEHASLYLFDAPSRVRAHEELLSDIPKFIFDQGRNQIPVSAFFERTYNQTPAHSDDLNSALIQSDDIEVITSTGGKRRKAQMIHRTDIIRLAPQRTFRFL